MLVKTAKPLSPIEMINMSKTKDALININGWKCRYMMAKEGQEIEVNLTYYDSEIGAFGLRESSNPNGKYDYLAFRIY